MKDYRRLRFSRTSEDRINPNCHPVVFMSSTAISDLVAGHEERMQGNIGRIHNEAGPIPKCNCLICKYYWSTKTKGLEHEMTGRHCYACLNKRYASQLKRYGRNNARRWLAKEKQKMARYDHTENSV